MAARGIGVRELARRAHYDPGYISKVCHGRKQASLDAVEIIDRVLEADGQLIRLASASSRIEHVERAPAWSTRIRAERKERGWPVRKMAEVLRGTVGNPDSLPPVYALVTKIRGWESGKHLPAEIYRLLYCEIFAISENELFGSDPADSTRLPAIAETQAVSGPDEISVPSRADYEITEDMIDVLARIDRLSRTVSPEIIRNLQDNLQNTVERYETLDHVNLLPLLLKQRSWIDALLGECSHPRQRQQLFEIAGATSGVLGYVAVGRGDFPLARAYCLESFQLGDFAEDANLQAWARGLQSFCEYYAGQYDEALRLARDGLNYAKSGPQSVRLTINGVARAMGKLGDAEGVHRAVGETYDLMSRNDVPRGVPSSIAFECYSAAQTASNAATAYVSLGIADKVQYYVGIALPEISRSESPWSRSLVTIDLALSLIRSKSADLDRAAELVLDALNISAGRPIISVQQRASEFVRDASDRWGNSRQISAVREAVSTIKIR